MKIAKYLCAFGIVAATLISAGCTQYGGSNPDLLPDETSSKSGSQPRATERTAPAPSERR